MRRRTFTLLAALVLFILVIIGGFVLKVRSADCSVMGGRCPDSIKDQVHSLVGTPLWKVSRELPIRLSHFSEIERYVSHISPLGAVTVEVFLRKSVMAVKPLNSETATLYTADGVPAGQTTSPETPVIEVTEQVDQSHVPFVVVLSYELNKMIVVKRFELSNRDLTVTDSQDRRLVYPLSGDIDAILGSTLLTFSQLNDASGKFNINGRPIVVHEVDFRFKNPVLRE